MRISSVLMLSLIAASSAHADPESGTGHKLVNEVCTPCHSLAPIEGTRDGPVGWRNTIYKMIQSGAQIWTAAEVDTLVQYLSTTYGPAAGQMHTDRLPADADWKPASDGNAASEYLNRLPAGKGADLVKSYCSMCHDLGRVIATRRSAEEWTRYTHVMLN